MNADELALARMDDDGHGCAITTPTGNTDSVRNADGTLSAGDWLAGWQAQAPAPVSTLPAERSRYLPAEAGGHLIRGAWSDPWWLARPGGGFAIARRWRSKTQEALTWDAAARRHRAVLVPAADERVIEPWPGDQP